MGAIALSVHHARPGATDLAKQVIAWADAHGHAVRIVGSDADVVGRPDLRVGLEQLRDGLDVAVSLGGDGTMLRTVDLLSDAGVPVLGVNVGHLGYLTVVEPVEMELALDRFFAGDHLIDERMLLAVTVDAPSWIEGEPRTFRALNEIVIEKTPIGHTVRLAVTIDGQFFTTYAADGLIVATPTGSTAYAFSARGPIVEPGLRAIALTPVSPHMLFDRTMVLKPTTTVRLDVIGPRPATLSVDGRNLGPLVEGDGVVCTAAAQPARLVTFERRDFHRILKSKFGLNDR
jgi:NAD+ kinase